ncbi:ATPase AAA, partial [Mycobacterium avium subsp. hominissuis 100]
MPIRWNVPRQATAAERLDAALADTAAAAGAVVLGPDGIGKSTLARVAAERFAAAHPGTRVRWVTGTPTERAVPFGAFSHLVRIAEIGKPAALLRAARASLGDAGLLLVVDDAHQLDVLSATLVYQLARAGAARLIVTARADGAPDAIAALWDDGLLTRIDVEAPDAPTSPGEIDAFLAELTPPARAVLEYLAVAEPLSVTDLNALAGDGAVAEAQRWGAAETRMRGGTSDDPVVYTAHPLFAERVRAALDPDDARQRRTELVTVLARHPSDRLSDRLRLVSLALDSDAPPRAADVVDAARQALRLGDLALG